MSKRRIRSPPISCVSARFSLQQTLQIIEQQFGPDHPQVASVLYDLAYLYREQGEYTKAEPLFQQTLQIREHHLGLEHFDVGLTLDALAYLSLDLGKYAETEPLFQRSLRLTKQHLEPDHPDIASPPLSPA